MRDNYMECGHRSCMQDSSYVWRTWTKIQGSDNDRNFFGKHNRVAHHRPGGYPQNRQQSCDRSGKCESVWNRDEWIRLLSHYASVGRNGIRGNNMGFRDNNEMQIESGEARNKESNHHY